MIARQHAPLGCATASHPRLCSGSAMFGGWMLDCRLAAGWRAACGCFTLGRFWDGICCVVCLRLGFMCLAKVRAHRLTAPGNACVLDQGRAANMYILHILVYRTLSTLGLSLILPNAVLHHTKPYL